MWRCRSSGCESHPVEIQLPGQWEGTVKRNRPRPSHLVGTRVCFDDLPKDTRKEWAVTLRSIWTVGESNWWQTTRYVSPRRCKRVCFLNSAFYRKFCEHVADGLLTEAHNLLSWYHITAINCAKLICDGANKTLFTSILEEHRLDQGRSFCISVHQTDAETNWLREN